MILLISLHNYQFLHMFQFTEIVSILFLEVTINVNQQMRNLLFLIFLSVFSKSYTRNVLNFTLYDITFQIYRWQNYAELGTCV